MVDFTSLSKNGAVPQKKEKMGNRGSGRHKKLVKISKVSMDIINEICRPIDATNRYINLTLQTIEEDSQSREFLLESKKGIIKTATLLRRLNSCAKQMEKEILEISSSSK